jgi:hypothetical protein
MDEIFENLEMCPTILKLCPIYLKFFKFSRDEQKIGKLHNNFVNVPQ